jgi:hypothetical protein
MEQKQFIERLSSIAHLRRVKPPVTANIRSASEPNEIYRHGQSQIIDKDNNDTWNWTIKELKHQAKPCEDCGKQVINRRIWRRIFLKPERHWRTTCSGCNLTQHPETKQYAVANSNVTSIFREWLNAKDK